MRVDDIAGDLEDAARLIRSREPHRAAWRVADAGGRLRELLRSKNASDLAGFDQDSGLGYRLLEKKEN